MAFKIDIKLNGIDDFEKKLDPTTKMNSARAIVRKHAGTLNNRIQKNMTTAYTGHWEGRKFVKPTGATRRSVTSEIVDNGLVAKVGPHTKYAIYLETGTVKMRPRPAIRPALQVEGQPFVDDIKKIINGN